MIGQLFRLYSLEISIIDIIRYNSYSTYSFDFSSTKMESYISSFSQTPSLKGVITILEKHHFETSLPPSSKTLCLPRRKPHPNELLTKEKFPFSFPPKNCQASQLLLQKKSISWSLPSNVSRALYRSLAKQKRLVSKPLDSKGAVQPRRFENSN